MGLFGFQAKSQSQPMQFGFVSHGCPRQAHSSSSAREAWEILTLLHLWFLQVPTQLQCSVHMME